MVLLSEVKKKITEDLEKLEDYDRLTLSKKSKELLGVLLATYQTFPVILDDNISDKLILEQYQAIYKALVKSAIQGINFVRTVRTMLGLPAEPIHEAAANKKEAEMLVKKAEEKLDISDRLKVRKSEPWVE